MSRCERIYMYDCPQMGIKRVDESVHVNHMFRYVVAGTFAQDMENRRAYLDFGCGSGYGTEFLGTLFSESWGVDKNPEAIQYATLMHRRSDTHFVGSLDEVKNVNPVSFVTMIESIEHLTESDAKNVLGRLRSMMSEDGMLFLSTPTPVRQDGSSDNPYHIKEYHPVELKELLSGYFKTVSLLPPHINRAMMAVCTNWGGYEFR